MGHLDYSKETRKNKHLTYRERLKIEYLLKDGKNAEEISGHIGCSRRTIERERLRGQVTQLKGATWEYFSQYDADYAHNSYRSGHEGKGACLKIGHDHKLCEHIEAEVLKGISPDVIASGLQKAKEKFSVTLCTRTIYNYLDKNIFLNVGYKDLICGRYRKKRREAISRPSYKNLRGRSIEERPANVEDRQEKGHWEMDLVVGGSQGSKAVLLTMTERTSRREIIRKLPDKTQDSVRHALDVMERQMGRVGFSKTFLSITVDNGAEFLGSREMERSCVSSRKPRTVIYYAHPYSAYERGSNENMNRMIRRFIPKGADIGQYTKKQIQRIENWLNSYPRKILDYRTPLEVYKQVA